MFEKIKAQFMKDTAEHAKMIKNDPYYAHCCGGGKVPAPCCEYCFEYDRVREACMLEWNNLDPVYYIPDRDDREPSDLCDQYRWSGEWEDE